MIIRGITRVLRVLLGEETKFNEAHLRHIFRPARHNVNARVFNIRLPFFGIRIKTKLFMLFYPFAIFIFIMFWILI